MKFMGQQWVEPRFPQISVRPRFSLRWHKCDPGVCFDLSAVDFIYLFHFLAETGTGNQLGGSTNRLLKLWRNFVRFIDNVGFPEKVLVKHANGRALRRLQFDERSLVARIHLVLESLVLD